MTGRLLHREVDRALASGKVFQILDLVVLVGHVGLGRPIDDGTLAGMARREAQNRLAGIRLDVDDGDVDGGLVLGERPLLDVAVLAQAPAALLQGLGLEGVEPAGAGHPWPDGQALGARDNILPWRAAVVLAGRPQIFLGLCEVFVEIVLVQFGHEFVIGARTGQQFLDLRLGGLVALANLEALIDGDLAQLVTAIHRIVHGNVEAVVGGRQCLAEAVLGFFEAVAGFLEQGVSGPEALVNLLDGVQLAQPFLHRVGQQAVLARQHQQVVFLLLVLEEALQFAGRQLAVGLDDDQRAWAGELEFVQLGQDLHVLVCNLANRLEDAGEPIDQCLIDLGLRNLPGIAFDLAREVLGFLDEEALFLPVQIPSRFAQALQGLLKLIRLALWGGQEFDHLAFRQADSSADGARQTGRQQQGHDLLRGIRAQLVVDVFGDGVAVVGDVVRDGRHQLGCDAFDLVLDLIVVEVQMLCSDQEDVIRHALLDALEQACGELHQATGLAEAFVLLEQRDEVLERGVKGVGLAHLLGDLLDAAGDDVATILGLLDLLGVLFGHIRDNALVRQLVDEPLLQDLVDLVAGQLHRRDGHGLAARLLLKIGDRVGKGLGLRLVSTREVGDHDGAVW